MLTDDLTGEPADETVRFALDGHDYEMELNAANAAALRRILSPYADAGRAISTGPRTSRGRGKSRVRVAGVKPAGFTAAGNGPGLSADRRAAIREWAKTQPQFAGINSRGRLPVAVIAAYDTAHGGHS
jgi:hypothetical protein